MRLTFPVHLVLLSCLLAGNALLWTNTPLSSQAYAEDAPSILRPATAETRTYRFRVDAIDPTPESNPSAALTAGLRGEGQLILYTAAFGSSTHTNSAGTEAVVTDGVITHSGGGDNPIPANGFVLSGHGAAAQWLTKFAKTGALATYDTESRQVTIQFTPTMYLNQVDSALERAKSRPPADEAAYQDHLSKADSCRVQLAAQTNQPLSTALVTLANRCEQEADRAFYNTISANQNEFRGAWVRPNSVKLEQIRSQVAQMKRLGVKNIFLETYYQGETSYPSRVMSDFGLPEQHPQYKGGDPLQLWITAAHEAGLNVHAWVQVFFAGNQKENAELYGPILQKYPQWRNVERPNWNRGIPVASDVEPGHYFIDPANPEVRSFLEKLLLEIVERYDIDGLNLDYIRYPASAPVNSPIHLSTTWGYTDSARNQFKTLIEQERQAAEQKKREALKAAGKPIPKAGPSFTTPSADPKDLTTKSPLWPRWVSWRKEQVSSFVKTISEKAHAAKPQLLISAVIFPSHDSTYAQKLQDYPRWAKEGWIQALTPIGLSPIPERMAQQATLLKEQIQDKIPVNVGIFALYNRQDPIELVRQIEALHQSDMPGVVLFDWSRLTPAYEDALQEGPFRQ